MSNGAIFYDLEQPLLPISMSRHYLLLNISGKVRDTLFQWNTNTDLYTAYSRVSFRMILSDLE